MSSYATLTNSVSANNNISYSAQLYTSSTTYGPLALPWFADYIHLIFWFFFLTSFIITIWLIQTFFMAVRGGEARFPIRETRGFSRAQTGDSFTAIIPMCWSITMLMHASVHSSNFDENTDSTNLSLSIIAYQWGWNYFFPIDTITKLTGNSYTNSINDVTTPTIGKYPSTLPLLSHTSINDILVKVSDTNAKPVNYNAFIAKENNTFIVNAISFLQEVPEAELNTFTNFKITQSLRNIVNKNIILSNVCEDLDSYLATNKFFSEVSTSRQVTPLENRDNLIHIGGLTSKIRVTAGVCLPSDLPIHVICASKDVVHSWAIPGLSIKIDCIPGYNCHRRLLIRWRGLFWGQCMEVCGRYHHWMPLLLKVTNIDIFISWCLAFLS